MKQRISGVHRLWLGIREPLRTIGQKPKDDPAARAAYDSIRPKIAEIDLASRLILVSVGNRITAARKRMLVTLAAISGLSLSLFFLGLWFTKRYISRPIELIEKVARQIRAGDFSQRIPIVSTDEVASLAMTMNEMCAELERSVERYRELFENASDIIYNDESRRPIPFRKSGRRADHRLPQRLTTFARIQQRTGLSSEGLGPA